MASTTPSPLPRHGGVSIAPGRRSLGFMNAAMKRKSSYFQLFLMTGIMMLSFRSLGQKYRIDDLTGDNELLRKENESLTHRKTSIKDALFAMAADNDASGALSEQLRRLFDEYQ